MHPSLCGFTIDLSLLQRLELRRRAPEYTTLFDALTAARALHLRVCGHYQRAAGRCGVCGDDAADQASQDPRWCENCYYDPNSPTPARTGSATCSPRALSRCSRR